MSKIRNNKIVEQELAVTNFDYQMNNDNDDNIKVEATTRSKNQMNFDNEDLVVEEEQI
ncbi:8973_t:CDS:2 [Scutellospora calospora]|uniref:8973_t:CDS:1 n=1 Tax=Scutellospora calospora TaxID=85575 RepID=A0ACA9MEU1_9GLOM|nr:8973_t:CDS:2 [Scutellospora calospora]